MRYPFFITAERDGSAAFFLQIGTVLRFFLSLQTGPARKALHGRGRLLLFFHWVLIFAIYTVFYIVNIYWVDYCLSYLSHDRNPGHAERILLVL